MKKDVIDRIKQQLEFITTHKNQLVIDTDCHPTDLSLLKGEILEKYQSTPNYYHGRLISTEELLSEMKMAEVDMALCWQNPAAIAYTDDKEENFRLLMAANHHIHQSALAYTEKIIPAGWTDPKALGIELAMKVVDICMKEYGFAIVKMNPAQNAYPIDSPEVFQVVEHIIGLGGVPAFHYGGDTPYTPASSLAKIAEKFPQSPIIAVHMGGGGSGYNEGEKLYLDTRTLGLKFPNLFFPLSAKRDTHIESDLITYQLAGSPHSEQIFCGSDAPYGRQSWNFGGYRAMFKSLMDTENHPDERIRKHENLFTPEVAQKYMGGNFAEFYTRALQKFMEIQGL
ncbi:amidohydrolase family protein [Flexithrix dorotheae]|uniref:amidohydrolase family protein n=1 Tax=Flexithrix dorotheae TaxID=70993 RepID=UPI00039CDEE8|nr:amidohydrolase family protein [Flexithrix dorotheae]